MSNDDRDRNDGRHLMTGWTEEDLAHVAADELKAALDAHGIGVRYVSAVGLDVDVAFGALRDAEVMMTLAFDGSGGPGSLYDRSTGSCIALSAMGPEAVTDDAGMANAVETALRLGWDWQVHPDMHGRRMGWHVSVTLSHTDANSVTAALNALRNLGGAA